jgi:hypothetical protein
MVNIDIKTISDEELAELLAACSEEFDSREAKARVKLIEEFHAAWSKLRTARILPRYDPDNGEYYVDLTKWDCFYFD